MNIAKLLEKRRTNWEELDRLCDAMEHSGRVSKAGQAYQGVGGISRFASLYRGACADLALADAYQLPPATVSFLHRLVARAHNQLYRAGKFQPAGWYDMIFREAPQQIFSDICVRIAAIVFFGLFSLSMLLAYHQDAFPGFAETIAGADQLEMVENMYEQEIDGSLSHYVSAAGYYIMHNTGIGLQCFAYGVLVIPCLYKLSFNAVLLGTIFGYMARGDVSGGDNFFHFVTAHGPFELTAIALSAGAGLRLGVGLFSTQGLRRSDSLRLSAQRAMPVVAAAAALFFLAALTEGFLSPSPAPYMLKAGWAIFSSSLISFYFIILGFPRRPAEAAARGDSSAAGQASAVQASAAQASIVRRS